MRSSDDPLSTIAQHAKAAFTHEKARDFLKAREEHDKVINLAKTLPAHNLTHAYLATAHANILRAPSIDNSPQERKEHFFQFLHYSLMSVTAIGGPNNKVIFDTFLQPQETTADSYNAKLYSERGLLRLHAAETGNTVEQPHLRSQALKDLNIALWLSYTNLANPPLDSTTLKTIFFTKLHYLLECGKREQAPFVVHCHLAYVKENRKTIIDTVIVLVGNDAPLVAQIIAVDSNDGKPQDEKADGQRESIKSIYENGGLYSRNTSLEKEIDALLATGARITLENLKQAPKVFKQVLEKARTLPPSLQKNSYLAAAYAGATLVYSRSKETKKFQIHLFKYLHYVLLSGKLDIDSSHVTHLIGLLKIKDGATPLASYIEAAKLLMEKKPPYSEDDLNDLNLSLWLRYNKVCTAEKVDDFFWLKVKILMQQKKADWADTCYFAAHCHLANIEDAHHRKEILTQILDCFIEQQLTKHCAQLARDFAQPDSDAEAKPAASAPLYTKKTLPDAAATDSSPEQKKTDDTLKNMSAEIAQLKNQLDAFKKESKQAEVARKEEEAASSAEISRLSEQLDKAKQQIHKIAAARKKNETEYKNQINTAKQQALKDGRAFETEVAKLSTSLSRAEQSLRDVTIEKDRLKTEVTRLTSQHDQSQKNITKLTAELTNQSDDHKKQQAFVHGQLQQIRQKLSDSDAEKTTITQDNVNLAQENSERKIQFAEAEKNHQEEMAGLKAESLRKDAEKETEIASLKASLAAQQQELDKLRAQAHEYHAKPREEKNIPGKRIRIPQQAYNFLADLELAGHEEVYLTGSALHGNAKDIDIVGAATTQQVNQVYPAATVFDHNEKRRIYYKGGPTKHSYFHSPQLQQKSLLEHAKTADFYCKALYAKKDGIVRDPTGKGWQHFNEGIISVILDKEVGEEGYEAALRERLEQDPVLMFRALDAQEKMTQQYGREFRCTPELQAAIQRQMPTLFEKPEHYPTFLHWTLNLISRASGPAHCSYLLKYGGFLPKLFPGTGFLPSTGNQTENIFKIIQSLHSLLDNQAKAVEWILKLLTGQHELAYPIAEYESRYIAILFDQNSHPIFDSTFVRVYLQITRGYFTDDIVQQTHPQEAKDYWVRMYLNKKLENQSTAHCVDAILPLISAQALTQWIAPFLPNLNQHPVINKAWLHLQSRIQLQQSMPPRAQGTSTFFQPHAHTPALPAGQPSSTHGHGQPQKAEHKPTPLPGFQSHAKRGGRRGL